MRAPGELKSRNPAVQARDVAESFFERGKCENARGASESDRDNRPRVKHVRAAYA